MNWRDLLQRSRERNIKLEMDNERKRLARVMPENPLGSSWIAGQPGDPIRDRPFGPRAPRYGRHNCYYCGLSCIRGCDGGIGLQQLQTDHLVPTTRATRTSACEISGCHCRVVEQHWLLLSESNTVHCCKGCNTSKNDLLPSEWLDEKSLRESIEDQEHETVWRLSHHGISIKPPRLIRKRIRLTPK